MNKTRLFTQMEMIQNLVKQVSEETGLYITAGACGHNNESVQANVTVRIDGEYCETYEWLKGDFKGEIKTSEYFSEVEEC